MQSRRPLNCLYDASFPTSTPSLVLPKSRGYTIKSPILPAIPPAARLPKKKLLNLINFNYFSFYVLGLTPAVNYLLSASLTEKLIAYVGKYLNTFAQFPLQKAKTPSSLATRAKQLTMPFNILIQKLYLYISLKLILD